MALSQAKSSAMFSGGLDSLAGIVDFASTGGKAVLVSHRPVSTMDSRQRKLFAELNKKFRGQLMHVPVWINKNENFSKEPTQRTRSFLFAALGTIVAESIEAAGIRFYENGVLSVNFPLAQEALRARASRTTHPKSLHLLSVLATAVIERDFTIDNPFLYKTKAEVVRVLKTHDATDLISHTCSCSHLIFQSSKQRHCGMCSQCIDRRVAIADADLLSEDPESDYVSNVFTGPRSKEVDRSIAVDYIRHGLELADLSVMQIAGLFNSEISRAVFYEENRREAADSIISMHQRHGITVRQVLTDQVKRNAGKLIEGTLEKNSLLALAMGQNYMHIGDALSADSFLETGLGQRQSTIDINKALKKLDQITEMLGSNPIARTGSQKRRKKFGGPIKRDTILFAAIVSRFKGRKYCTYLDQHKIIPKWADEGPATYRDSYASKHYKKKVQDEKTRARIRMGKHPDSAILDAFVTHLRNEFDGLSMLLNSRNSLDASKKVMPQPTA